jgi:hypothetical protein
MTHTTAPVRVPRTGATPLCTHVAGRAAVAPAPGATPTGSVAPRHGAAVLAAPVACEAVLPVPAGGAAVLSAPGPGAAVLPAPGVR